MCAKQSVHLSARLPKSLSAVPAKCVLALMAGALTTGCWRLPSSEESEVFAGGVLASKVAGLETFDSPDAFKQYLAERVEAGHDMPGLPGGFDGDGEAEAGQPMPAPGGGAADGGYSTTNIQESGVDESDVVKNDATRLYVLGANRLHIVRAVPADHMARLATVDLPGQPESLFLKGDRVVAISRDYQDWTRITTVTILNVASGAEPVLEATVELEGSLIDSRLIGSKLHLVLRFTPMLPEDGGETAIQQGEPGDLIPDLSATLHDGSDTTTVHRDLVRWHEFYRPNEPDGYGVIAVVTLDVDSGGTPIQSAGVMADADTVYASAEALYLANGGSGYFMGGSGEETTIYKFALTNNGAVPVGSGTIPGRLLNRFSLGEYDGYLRAATTVGHVAWGGGDATNNVYVLAPEDGELNIVGEVEDIAPGEKIYSARFIGQRGFLVTFKKVDPLFTLDLSDPMFPKVVGELKVPGYSDYIHPLGENHLLTIGKDAVDMGDMAWYQGVQLSIFDVSDFSDPQRVDVEIIGERGTESEALYDPHAFNYFAPANMLAVPMTIAEGAGPEPSSHGQPTFQGLCLCDVFADEGIQWVGRISTGSTEGRYHSSGWTRGIFMSDHVYAVTSTEVQAVPLANLDAEPLRLPLE